MAMWLSMSDSMCETTLLAPIMSASNSQWIFAAGRQSEKDQRPVLTLARRTVSVVADSPTHGLDHK